MRNRLIRFHIRNTSRVRRWHASLEDRGQATRVRVGALARRDRAIVVAWATSGGGAGKIGRLFDRSSTKS